MSKPWIRTDDNEAALVVLIDGGVPKADAIALMGEVVQVLEAAEWSVKDAAGAARDIWRNLAEAATVDGVRRVLDVLSCQRMLASLAETCREAGDTLAEFACERAPQWIGLDAPRMAFDYGGSFKGPPSVTILWSGPLDEDD